MIDLSHIPSQYGNADVQVFLGAFDAFPRIWQKPRGKSMAHILLIGAGGNGGTGATGANSTAAGGGGGGSGAQTSLTVPLTAIPDQLYLVIPNVGINNSASIGVSPVTASANTLAIAGCGAAGGNASGATFGAAGSAGAVATAATMPLGWMWADQVLAGQAGGPGSTAVDATALTLPTTGLLVTGGTGAGGVPGSAVAGTSGGNITGSGIFPTLARGVGSAAGTTPAGFGQAGYQPVQGLLRFYGGTGGGSTHGSATGAGLVKSFGGNGMPGCGGGGGGGGLTGSTGGGGGNGGPAFCMIVCW